jgi:DNA-binding NtrC family response regulator
MGGVRNKHPVMERASEPMNHRVWLSLADEIGCAARSHVPVLITGGPEEGREIACAIRRRSRMPSGALEIIDCRAFGALGRVMFAAANATGRSSILLLQEVHALDLNEQAQFEHRLAEMRISRGSTGLRIIATSSAPLFERVLEGSFDERLYYRLNLIHMVVS